MIEQFRYSDNALDVRSLFFEAFNDIDIYVEDTSIGAEIFYTQLFTRLIDGKYKINKVFTLGGKENILKACTEYNSKKTNEARKKLYIVDGDIDLILNKKYDMPYLYNLDVYCIENYLIDENAFINILYENSGKYQREKIKELFNFDNLINELHPLIDLYILFAISKSLELGIEYSKLGKLITQSQKTCFFDKIKSENHISEYQQIVIDTIKSLSSKKIKKIYNNIFSTNIKRLNKNKVNEFSEKIFFNELQKIKNNWQYSNDNVLMIVSGKDFLLPILRFEMDKIVRQACTKESLKLRLALNCSLEKMNKLKNKLMSI